MRDRLFAIGFIAPAFVIYSIFMVLPIILSLVWSFYKWDGVSAPSFVGWSNYAALWKDADYWISIKNTTIIVFVAFLIKIPAALVLAYLTMRAKRLQKLFRTIFFFPVVVAPIAIGLMFSLFLNPNLGIVNSFLNFMGLSFLERNWLSDPHIVLYTATSPFIWQYIGMFFVIFLTGMFSIPQEFYESAQIDGASSFRVFFQIVLPLIWDVIQLTIILAFTGSLKLFDYPWIMSAGGPGMSSTPISLYMFKQAFVSYHFGYGSMITFTILIYALVFVFLIRKLLTRKDPIQF